MRLMCDVSVTIYSGEKQLTDKVKMEFEDENYEEFDFSSFFKELIYKLKPSLRETFPKDKIIFNISNIRKLDSSEKLSQFYQK